MSLQPKYPHLGRSRPERVAYGVLGVSLLVTGLICLWAHGEIRGRQQATFAQAAAKLRHTMALHAASCFNILKAINGFCAQDRPITAAEFRGFLEIQGLVNAHPGIFDVGYIAWVPPEQRAKMLAFVRDQGLPPTRLPTFSSAGKGDYMLMFWDDFGGRPAPPVGCYVFDEPERVAAMDRACDSGTLASSGRMNIYRGNGLLAPNGFILYAPVYRSGAPLNTPEERRAALKGLAYASFSVLAFWGTVYQEAGEPSIDLEVFAGRERRLDRLWFDSDAEVHGAANRRWHRSRSFSDTQPVTGLGREWTLHCSSLRTFESTPEVKLPTLFFVAGAAMSGVLFSLARNQTRARQRSEMLAAELRVTHEAVAQEKERLAVTLASINEGVITLDDQGAIVLLNRTAEEMARVQTHPPQGRPLAQVLPVSDPQTQAPVDCPVAEVLRAGQVWQTPRPARLGARGQPGPLVHVTLTPIRDAQGRVTGTVAVFRDVTERQRLIEEQLKSSKLESVGLLAGGIAHDFNNLLTAIGGNLSLAADEITDRPEAAACLREAERACARARDLTHQLLTFARGGAPIRKTARLSEAVRESARFATRGATARCECCLAEDLWPVEADETQLSQVIHNIVLNAVEAMPEGGVIEISGENFRVTLDQVAGLNPGAYVRLSIQDRGPGIRPEHLDRIFDPYFSTKQRGSGLGLATAYSIVKHHEGLLRVESALGRGTRFEIYLPASNRTAPAPPTSRTTTSSFAGRRILIMDDERPVLDCLTRMLQRLGCEVLATADGAEAVRQHAAARSQGQAIDAVILDLTVPAGIGGKQTLPQLRALDPALPAIVSSGYSNDPVMADHTAHGFQAVVPKPYTLSVLAEALHRVLPRS